MSKRNGLRCIGGCARLSTQGFTIIEFIIVLVLLAIAVGLAIPSLRQFSANNQLASANNTIVTGLNLARGTAITTGDDTTICPSADGATCTEDNWDSGWIVFNDIDGDGSADADEVIRVVSIESEVTNSGFGENIVFQADGTTAMGSDATITNCKEQEGSNQSCADVVVGQFGMIESNQYNHAGD